VLLLPWDKLDVSDNLAVCFGALALAQATGILPDIGALIYGEGYDIGPVAEVIGIGLA
jgi:hypothetical protein